MQRWLAFTLVEIVLVVFILMLLLLLAVPSLSGLLANNRLRRSLNGFNNLVRQAQERSVAERPAATGSFCKRPADLSDGRTEVGSRGGVDPQATFGTNKQASGRMDFLAIRNMRACDCSI